MSTAFTLATERLCMRRIVPSDLEDLVALDADPEVMRFISDGVPTPRSVYRDALLARMCAFAEHPYGYAAAYAGATFVGWFHLRPSVVDETVLELGYRLRREAWGKGLATEGSRALVRYAFDDLDQNAVDACAMPGNAASIAVMRKCGMQRMGSFVHPRGGMTVEHYLVRRDLVRRDESPSERPPLG